MTNKNDGFDIRFHGYRFKPSLWPTLMAIPAILFMIALGTWQVERLAWKNDIISTRTARTTSPPIALPGPGDDLAGIEFYPVAVRGAFHHDRELYLGARSMRGNTGYHVITPFELEDGRFVLFDRGWVPLNRKEPSTRVQGQVEGVVSLTGVLRVPGRKGPFQPDNVPADNFWFFVDVPEMAAHAGVTNILPFYLDAGAGENPGGFPIGGQTRINLPNNHLSYAITWYLLALAFAVIYVIYHTRREDDGA